MPGLLRHPAMPRHFMQRQHGIVARMVGVVAGGTVDQLAVLAQREIVGNRDRLVVSDQKAVLGLRSRRPRTNPRARTRSRKIDRRVAAEFMVVGTRRHGLFMGAPTELRGLQAFGDKPLDRPGIDELAAWL